MKVKYTALSILLAFGAVLAVRGAAVAQRMSPFSLAYEIYPYEKLSNPQAGTFLENVRVQAKKLQVNLSFPLRFARTRGAFIGWGVAYEMLQLDYENWDKSAAGPVMIGRMHSLGLPITVRGQIGEHWGFMGYAVPGLESDFEGRIDSKDFAMQAILLFTRRFSPSSSLGFGGLFVRNFGRPVPLPALSVDWRGGRWSASGLLPISQQVSFRIVQELSVGAAWRVNGSQYSGEPEIYGLDKPEIRYREITFGPLVRVTAGGGATLELQTGLAFSRRFQLYDGSSRVSDYSLKNTMYTRIAITAGGGGRGRDGGRGGGGRGRGRGHGRD